MRSRNPNDTAGAQEGRLQLWRAPEGNSRAFEVRQFGTAQRQPVSCAAFSSEAGKGGKIRLNYLVGSVTWRPEYKLRAGKVNEDVQVDYQANLMQHSGEEWNQVNMTLSTAQPMLNASPPDLCMLQPILVVRGAPGGPDRPLDSSACRES